ncbi:acyltransferase [Bacteroides fragilis]
MKIGTNCSITTWNLYSEAFLISIGNNVQITSGVKIFTHGAGWVLRNKYANYDAFGKVIIGNNVYIGNNAMIMPGITIGSNVVIAAGAVVTKKYSRWSCCRRQSC